MEIILFDYLLCTTGGKGALPCRLLIRRPERLKHGYLEQKVNWSLPGSRCLKALPGGPLLSGPASCRTGHQSSLLTERLAVSLHPDLGQLLDGLTTQGLIISSEVEAADQLSLYAAQTRYPGLGTPVNKAEYQEC